MEPRCYWKGIEFYLTSPSSLERSTNNNMPLSQNAFIFKQHRNKVKKERYFITQDNTTYCILYCFVLLNSVL